jgi:DNA repair protein RadC
MDPRDNVDLPRERLQRHGIHRLTDDELVALVLGTGTRGRPARMLARDVVRRAGGLAALSRATVAELVTGDGVGAARAAQLAAAFELGRRALEDDASARPMVIEPADIFRRLRPRLGGLVQEHFIAIAIDRRNRVIGEFEIARGLVDGVEVHPREVFRPLIRVAAVAAVLAHNHPSGDPTPSNEDLALTHRLRQAGDVLGIPIMDHVVITGDSFRSIAEWQGTQF